MSPATSSTRHYHVTAAAQPRHAADAPLWVLKSHKRKPGGKEYEEGRGAAAGGGPSLQRLPPPTSNRAAGGGGKRGKTAEAPGGGVMDAGRHVKGECKPCIPALGSQSEASVPTRIVSKEQA